MSSHRSWSQVEKDTLARLWAKGESVTDIAQRMGRTRGSIWRQRAELNLPDRQPVFFLYDFSKNGKRQAVSFQLPLRKGTDKLLKRADTLREWVEDGRDDYELARAFHVPIADVVTVIAKLGLVRPYGVEADLGGVKSRRCLACRSRFDAPTGRFRCDACLHAAANLHDSEYTLGVM